MPGSPREQGTSARRVRPGAALAPQLLTIQVVFLQTSCTTSAPLTCREAAFDGQEHSKIPIPTSKAEPKALPTFLW